jgi:ATP synthase protein I
MEIKQVFLSQGDTLKWQLIVNLVLAVIFWFMANFHAGLSVLLGMLTVVVGSFVGALVAQQANTKKTPTSIILAILKGELVKIVLIALLLLLIFKIYTSLLPIALIIGLAVTALMAGRAFISTNI